MIGIITILMVLFFIGVGITEGMNQRVPITDQGEQNFYHWCRNIASWTATLMGSFALGDYWYLGIVAGLSLDALYNRVLQATREIYVNKAKFGIYLIEAHDFDYKQVLASGGRLTFWQILHITWWADWLRWGAVWAVWVVLAINATKG